MSRLRALAARRARRVNGAEQRAKHDALHQIQHVGKKSERSESGAQERKKRNTQKEKWIKRNDQLLQHVIIICCPGWECASTLHLCRKCGREAGSDFHENKTGGRADQRGCLILSCGKAGRRSFCNNEVKRTIASCDDLRGGASLLSGSSSRGDAAGSRKWLSSQLFSLHDIYYSSRCSQI